MNYVVFTLDVDWMEVSVFIQFDSSDLGVPSALMANIDEISLLIDPGDNITALLSSEEDTKTLNKCGYSLCIRAKSEKDEDKPFS